MNGKYIHIYELFLYFQLLAIVRNELDYSELSNSVKEDLIPCLYIYLTQLTERMDTG